MLQDAHAREIAQTPTLVLVQNLMDQIFLMCGVMVGGEIFNVIWKIYTSFFLEGGGGVLAHLVNFVYLLMFDASTWGWLSNIYKFFIDKEACTVMWQIDISWKYCLGFHRLFCSHTFFENFIIYCTNWYLQISRGQGHCLWMWTKL